MGGTFAIAPPMSREERLTYIENLRKDLGMHTEGEKNAAVVAHPLLSDGEQKPQVAGDESRDKSNGCVRGTRGDASPSKDGDRERARHHPQAKGGKGRVVSEARHASYRNQRDVRVYTPDSVHSDESPHREYRERRRHRYDEDEEYSPSPRVRSVRRDRDSSKALESRISYLEEKLREQKELVLQAQLANVQRPNIIPIPLADMSMSQQQQQPLQQHHAQQQQQQQQPPPPPPPPNYPESRFPDIESMRRLPEELKTDESMVQEHMDHMRNMMRLQFEIEKKRQIHELSVFDTSIQRLQLEKTGGGVLSGLAGAEAGHKKKKKKKKKTKAKDKTTGRARGKESGDGIHDDDDDDDDDGAGADHDEEDDEEESSSDEDSDTERKRDSIIKEGQGAFETLLHNKKKRGSDVNASDDPTHATATNNPANADDAADLENTKFEEQQIELFEVVIMSLGPTVWTTKTAVTIVLYEGPGRRIDHVVIPPLKDDVDLPSKHQSLNLTTMPASAVVKGSNASVSKGKTFYYWNERIYLPVERRFSDSYLVFEFDTSSSRADAAMDIRRNVVAWTAVDIGSTDIHRKAVRKIPIYNLPIMLGSAGVDRTHALADPLFTFQVNRKVLPKHAVRKFLVTNASNKGDDHDEGQRILMADLDSEDYPGVPSRAWLRVSTNIPLSSGFKPGVDKVGIFVDGARFLPDNCSLSKVTCSIRCGQLLDEIVCDDFEVFCSLRSNVYFPKYKLRKLLETKGWDDPHAVLLIRIDTIDVSDFRKQMRIVGFAVLPLFIRTTDEGDDDDSPTNNAFGVLNKGTFQLPLYVEYPINPSDLEFNPFREASLSAVPRLHCASVLIRIASQEEYEMVGDESVPEYSSKTYDSTRTIPTAMEVLQYKRMLQRNSISVSDSLSAIQTNDKRLADLTNEQFTAWIKEGFEMNTMQNEFLDYNYSFPYRPDIGFYVSVDSANALSSSVPSYVLTSLFPPGDFYLKKNDSDTAPSDLKLFADNDINAALKAPEFLDGWKHYSNVLFHASLCMIFEVRCVRADSEVGWGIISLFGQGSKYFLSGQYAVPLFRGKPYESLLNELLVHDPMEVIETALKQKQLRYLGKLAAVYVRLLSGQRAGQLRYPINADMRDVIYPRYLDANARANFINSERVKSKAFKASAPRGLAPEEWSEQVRKTVLRTLKIEDDLSAELTFDEDDDA